MKNSCLIIGCGKIAAAHASYLKKKVPLYFFSPIIEEAQHYNQKFSGHGIMSSWQQALSSEINNWIICSPVQAHYNQVLEGIERGKTILCEKPLCENRQQLQEIEQRLQQSNARLMVAENYCYKPLVQKLQKIINSGKIGSVKEVVLRKEFTQHSPGWREQFGALIEGGIHFVAMANAIVKKQINSVKADIKKTNAPERSSIVTINYEGGTTAKILYSWETPSKTKGILQHSKIKGEHGTITFESNGLYIWSKGLRIPNLCNISGKKEMLNDFLQLTTNPNHTLVHPFTDTIKDLNVVFDAYGQPQ